MRTKMNRFKFPSLEGWTRRAASAQEPVRVDGAASLTGGPFEIPQGPYIVWWQWSELHPNPAYKEWQAYHEDGTHRPSEYLPQGQMIVRYNGPEDSQGVILWQNEPDDYRAKYEAEKMWESLKEEYPVWHATKMGGARSGAGRPGLGESRYIGIDVPMDLVRWLDDRVEEAQASGEKVSRNAIIRELIRREAEQR